MSALPPLRLKTSAALAFPWIERTSSSMSFSVSGSNRCSSIRPSRRKLLRIRMADSLSISSPSRAPKTIVTGRSRLIRAT